MLEYIFILKMVYFLFLFSITIYHLYTFFHLNLSIILLHSHHTVVCVSELSIYVL